MVIWCYSLWKPLNCSQLSCYRSWRENCFCYYFCIKNEVVLKSSWIWERFCYNLPLYTGFMKFHFICHRKVENATIRRLLQINGNPPPSDANGLPPPGPQTDLNSNSNRAPSPSPSSTSPSNTKSSSPSAVPSPSAPGEIPETHEVPSKKWVIFLTVGVLLIVVALSAAYVLRYLTQKSVTIMPWTTGLSGQLQKAFVTGKFTFWCYKHFL